MVTEHEENDTNGQLLYWS